MASDTDALQFIERSETAATVMRTAVGLGSNLGDRLGNLHAAREAILKLSNVSPPIVS